MKLPKSESSAAIKRASLNIELDVTLIEALTVMEKHSKNSKTAIVETALKRFIATHKDYFPE